MTTLLYDSSFEGFLTAVFEAYERKLHYYRIQRQERAMREIFGVPIYVQNDKAKAARVWQGLKRRLTNTGLDFIYCASLSEQPEAEDALVGYIQHIFKHTRNVESDYSNRYVLQMARINKMVHREGHRMKAFIRFQLTKDGIYYAAIEPDFNVIPLIISHFKNRYADQRWLIYDLRRKYGIYYNLQTVETVTLTFAEGNQEGRDVAVSFDEQEVFYQQLWKDYFKSVNIGSRRNMSLHIRHVPLRYWRHLTEKGVEL